MLIDTLKPLTTQVKLQLRNPVADEDAPYLHGCALEHGEHFKNQAFKARRACKKLVLVSIVSAVFCITEAVGGTLSGSLAILCDAAH